MSARRDGRRKQGFFARQSLLTRYILIVVSGFLFIPIIIPLASLVYMTTSAIGGGDDVRFTMKYGNAGEVEMDWHAEARSLRGGRPDEVNARLRALADEYPEASLFWVDAEGQTRLRLPEDAEGEGGVPDHWSADDAVRFMKTSVGGDPFTVVAFLGENNGEAAFMALQLPRKLVEAGPSSGSGTTFFVAFVCVSFVLFTALSLLFFLRIRKRLLLLQAAMSKRGEHGLPAPVEVKRADEIGGLEGAFNGMVEQLKAGRERQQEEEELRKKLISNLSHDLRTPLTVMRGHLYTLGKEPLSGAGKESLATLERKADGLGELIDNLLAYTLMTSGRYRLEPEPADVWRLARESAAAWYPVWEKAGIEADIRLPADPLVWKVDKLAFRRILDNLFQNIVRHAAGGRYAGLYAERRDGRLMLVIEDRGPGLSGSSEGKGAGIGLAIVEYLLREMGLAWERESSEIGTRILIYQSGSSETWGDSR
ncbi:sensor histidine kinase [Paenibacillus soyae]|uniref:histidine kinase n=1 Tax=Paenibacillus soyae TaxID=2969249 RepID=A0A9X2MQU6_9BACL|nr:HAMP domain-containing sensor histidine kinase [Paenibacillus soyae]MCR2804106.1 HAMP domain-containing histidine kinase [Paenibacillus soyae]